MAKQKAKRDVYAMERDVGTTGRELNEAGRTAERATEQGIVRKKERESGCGCGTGEEGCYYGFVPCGSIFLLYRISALEVCGLAVR